jgi:hypothetical protein
MRITGNKYFAAGKFWYFRCFALIIVTALR